MLFLYNLGVFTYGKQPLDLSDIWGLYLYKFKCNTFWIWPGWQAIWYNQSAFQAPIPVTTLSRTAARKTNITLYLKKHHIC